MENKDNILKNLNFKIDEVKLGVENPYKDYMENYIINRIPAIVYNINDDNLLAFVPNNFEKYNILEENNIIYQKVNYVTDKGVIITGDGDLKFVIIMPDNIDINIYYFIRKIKNYLLKYFINVDVHNNDIMIKKKKVIGTVKNNINNMNVFMFQITFNDRTELIKKICTESIKEVGFIDPNILNAETLLEEILSWFTNE